MSGPRVLMAGGGTLGHLYPCLAVAEELEAETSAEVRFIGATGRVDEHVLRKRDLSHELIDARPLPYRFSPETLKGLVALWRAVRQSRQIIKRWQPHAVFSTGGYVGSSVGIAARMEGVPLVLHAADVDPDRGNRMLTRWAKAVTVVSPHAQEVFGPKAVLTGNPIRREVAEASREAGISELGLDPSLPAIVVAGGSQGARRLNMAVLEALPQLTGEIGAQIIHLSGALDYPKLLRESRERYGSPANYHLIEHLPNLGLALAAADLAITRAGSSSLAELCLHGVPMIIVPYPHAGGHQRLNAQPLAEAGAAVVIEDEQFTAARLAEAVRGILSDEARRLMMAQAAQAEATPSAASDVADVIMKVVGRSSLAEHDLEA